MTQSALPETAVAMRAPPVVLLTGWGNIVQTATGLDEGLAALSAAHGRIDMILAVYGLIPSTPAGWRGPWQATDSYELHQWVFDLDDDGTPAGVPFAHDGVALLADDVPRRSSPVPGASGLPACRVTVRDSRRL